MCTYNCVTPLHSVVYYIEDMLTCFPLKTLLNVEVCSHCNLIHLV